MPIEIKNVTHEYSPGTPFSTIALREVTLMINEGDFVGLVGHTGSGKSTLIQMLNGLIKPTSGSIAVDGCDITKPKIDLKQVRSKVGMIFQYPEYQLFEETVFDDVAFGPRNLGIDSDVVSSRVENALKAVGLNSSTYTSRSPFELSGGEMRRVAIAGILAMQPKYLILDEPTAGLDPRGREIVLALLKKLHSEGLTVVLVSHSMEDIMRMSSKIAVLHKGQLVLQGDPRSVLNQPEILQSYGLDIPDINKVMYALKLRGASVKTSVLTPSEAASEIAEYLEG